MPTHPPGLSQRFTGIDPAPTRPAAAAPRTDRHEALRALHEALAKTERHVQDLVPPGMA